MQPVRFPVEGVDYSGTCKASVTSTSVSCYCEFEIGGLKVSGFDSACLTISKKQIMYIRQVTFLIMLCSSVMAFAQKAYLSVMVNPIDAITESTLTQARVSLISTIDSTEVDTFRRITILGDVIKRYTYVYDNSHATLVLMVGGDYYSLLLQNNILV